MNKPVTPELKTIPVLKRRVIHVAGFDPITPEGLARHMTSGLKRFGALWNAEATASEPTLADDKRTMDWTVRARGPNWATETRYTVFRWDEVMEPYFQRPWLTRVLTGYAALLRFTFAGMIVRYFRTNIRYGFFVLYPFLLLVGAALLGIGSALIVVMLDPRLAAVIATLAGLAVFVISFRAAGSLFHLQFALSDWQFADDLVKGRVAGLDTSLDRFTALLLEASREVGFHEVLVSGYSLGAMLLVDALEKALAVDPDLCKRTPGFVMLTVGSSILKIGLHPHADALRRTVARVGREPSLYWAEYQAKIDYINFYKTDPVELLSGEATGRPIVLRRVQIGTMMAAPGEWLRKANLLLRHRQFVLPNVQRYFYDFYQICFGPMRLTERVDLTEGAASAFAADGSYKPGWVAKMRQQIAAAAVARQ